MAAYSGNHFYQLDPNRKLKFLPNAGIVLPEVTLSDTGYYTVGIQFSGERQLYHQGASLHIYDVPVITSDKLHAFILPERVYSSTTREWHVQLGCRTPLPQGHPALPIIWTTPSNKTVKDTSYNNNTSILTLGKPYEEGYYSCSLDRSAPEVKCISRSFGVIRTSSVLVKRVHTRLSLLEGNLEALRTETYNLTDSVCHLTDLVQQLQLAYDMKMVDNVTNLNHTADYINEQLDDLRTIIRMENLTVASMVLELKTQNEDMAIEARRLQMVDKLMAESMHDLKLQHENISSALTLLQRKHDNMTAVEQSTFNNVTDSIDCSCENISDVKIIIENISSVLENFQNKYDNMITSILQQLSDTLYMRKGRFGLKYTPSRDDMERRPASCIDVKKYDNMSGIHTLFLRDNKKLEVYCDQTTDGGGWTVIQRRQDGSENFFRKWTEYEEGFGNLSTEFWIGLANLHDLTKTKNVKLRVDLTDFNGSTVHAVYSTFYISGAAYNYRLNVGGYTGTAGDSLQFQNQMQFSTSDRDHDTDDDSCANLYHGGWWYGKCYRSNLNGLYHPKAPEEEGIHWYHWKNDWRIFKRAEMKIKE